MANDSFKPLLRELASKHELYPEEKLMEIRKDKNSLTIGIPKETEFEEKRLCLTPHSVGLLVTNGHQVILETGAGDSANYTDHAYSEKGARIGYSRKEVFEANIVLKVEPPTLDEVDMMTQGATLLSALQFAKLNQDVFKALAKKKITAAAFEWIEDKGGLKPIVRSMSEIASNCIISIAGEYLSNTNEGKGNIFGGVTGVPPLKLIVLGAGTIGENVTRIARSMGAEVQVYDNHHYKLRRLKKDLGEQVYTAIIDPVTLQREIRDADVVIGALRGESDSSLCVISEEMVASMKDGAVIIDASISQGGCVETSRLTTHSKPTYVVNGVIHYCVPNIASRVSHTATKALSYILTPMVLQIAKYGGIEALITEKEWFRKGVYMYKGCMTSHSLANRFDMPYKDINLFLAARF